MTRRRATRAPSPRARAGSHELRLLELLGSWARCNLACSACHVSSSCEGSNALQHVSSSEWAVTPCSISQQQKPIQDSLWISQ